MKYQSVDVSLSEWRNLIFARYPSAKIYVAAEEFGGTREAYNGKDFVGDWDGGSEIPGRIVIKE